MTTINLLPWREKKRLRQQKLMLLGVLVSLFSTLLIIIFFKLYLHHALTNQLHRNSLLHNELQLLDIQMKELNDLRAQKKEVNTKINYLRTLQHARIELVHLFDELAKIIPAHMSFYQLERVKERFVLRGYAQSNKSVSLLLRRINNNQWLHTPVLVEIKKREEGSHNENEFFLSFLVKKNKWIAYV